MESFDFVKAGLLNAQLNTPRNREFPRLPSPGERLKVSKKIFLKVEPLIFPFNLSKIINGIDLMLLEQLDFDNYQNSNDIISHCLLLDSLLSSDQFNKFT